MPLIPLGGGHNCIVDSEDFDFLSQWKWQLHPSGYARRTSSKNGKHFTVWMHRLILNAPNGIEVDHINRDKLDNRRSNLRQATRAQNAKNIPKPKGLSGFTGVRYRPSKFGLNFESSIQVNNKRICLGRFASAEEAYQAYINAVQKYHGQFGNI